MITVRTRSTRLTRNAYASKRCPTGSVVQSVLFARDAGWTTAEARAWAKRHKFIARKVDVTAQYIRLRQRDPKSLRRLRTIPFGRGIKSVVGWPTC
jgi:hypothetical protein